MVPPGFESSIALSRFLSGKPLLPSFLLLPFALETYKILLPDEARKGETLPEEPDPEVPLTALLLEVSILGLTLCSALLVVLSTLSSADCSASEDTFFPNDFRLVTCACNAKAMNNDKRVRVLKNIDFIMLRVFMNKFSHKTTLHSFYHHQYFHGFYIRIFTDRNQKTVNMFLLKIVCD